MHVLCVGRVVFGRHNAVLCCNLWLKRSVLEKYYRNIVQQEFRQIPKMKLCKEDVYFLGISNTCLCHKIPTFQLWRPVIKEAEDLFEELLSNDRCENDCLPGGT